MKKLFVVLFAIVLCVTLTLAACQSNNWNTNNGNNSNTDTNSDNGNSSSGNNGTETTETPQPASDTDFDNVQEVTGDFALTTEDGDYHLDGSVYTIVAAGTYTLSGSLVGQIVVDAADADVVLELNGVTIEYGADSPIKIVAANNVDISAKKDTDNVVKDTRSAKTTDTDTQGEGAIYAKADLKLKGNGTLVVSAGYNNGVHTTKDLTIKNLSLKVTAVNNALKGNDSVTITSGSVVAISTKGNGVKTEHSDSKNDKQRGTVTIEDGALTVYAAGDGIEAAYDFVANGGTVTVYTGSYSAYTAAGASTTSYKGIKVANELVVNAGTIVLNSYDDGLHADYGTTLENGTKGKGNITIAGGNITISVYSPTQSTGSGRFGPGGWGRQTSVKGSDGIHADNTLTIRGGTIQIDSAYEGLEATYVVIEGGNTTIYANDDGVNAAKKTSNSPCITISGGLLDVTVPTSGDTDGIDSNGNYVQTGGVVITKGPGSASGSWGGGGAWALDTDGSVSIRGGTLIVFGGIESTPGSSVTKTVCSSYTVSTGSHTVTVGGNTYTTTLSYQTNGCVVYSDAGSASLK